MNRLPITIHWFFDGPLVTEQVFDDLEDLRRLPTPADFDGSLMKVWTQVNGEAEYNIFYLQVSDSG